MSLRPYQQESFDAAKEWLRKCVDPALLMLATGAGKSHLVAAIASWLNEISGKKVLCLAPSKELVEQNREKYLATGAPASLYCASIGKDLRHDVVFGSPKSVYNSIDKFCGKFCAVIIDEAHGMTPTIRNIVAHLKQQNPKCRVLGLTATPYRLGSGRIYEINPDNSPVPEDETKDPYFKKLLHEVTAQYLIDAGYLTSPHADPDHINGYGAGSLELNARGQFDASEVAEVFEGKGRLTSAIVADIAGKSRYRKGVIIFAATRQHAAEVMESLPPHDSRIVTGDTPKSDREKIIADYKAQRFKYLVNVAVLTTGFDAPHVDVVAILRATESATLMQQIMGRGLRLGDPSTAGDLAAIANSDKPDCLILDYAGNISRHCSDGDLFNPEIKVAFKSEESFYIDATCPECGTVNKFSGRPNPDEFQVNQYGYFVDLAGTAIKTDDDLEMPAHFGRRCLGQHIANGHSERCEYRWTYKACHECDHENDIAARYCEQCKEELIDPNEKLSIDFQRMKKDPYSISTDKVLSWSCQLWNSQAGNESVRVEYTTEYRAFSVWYMPSKSRQRHRVWESFCGAVFGEYVSSPSDLMELIDDFQGRMPETITVKQDRDTKFFTVYGHNNEEDKDPSV